MPEVSTKYQVRKVTSGWNGRESFIVVKLGGGRVSVHADGTRESAQAAADDLNILDMVRDHAEDPRPFTERLAEARATYHARKAI